MSAISYNFLRSNEDRIEDGYGEYLVYNQSSSPLTKEVYDKVYEIINRYKYDFSLTNRSEVLRKEIKQIEPDLEICFVPRTLIELEFIRAGIEEEIEKQEGCLQQLQFQFDKNKTCWHPPYRGINEEQLKSFTFRLNDRIINKWKPTGSFSGTQITAIAEDQLSFFRQHAVNFPKLLVSEHKYHECYPSITKNFANCTSRVSWAWYNMLSISSDVDASIVRNAIALECDKVAQNAFIIYRGGDLSRDKNHQAFDNTSLSYGTSLFAGSFFDPGATVFHYSHYYGRDTYALVVPFQEERDDCPFKIPKDPFLLQLAEKGEYFHVRTKLEKETMGKSVRGIAVWEKDIRKEDLPISNLSGAELSDKYNAYLSKAILLSPVNKA